MIYKDNREEIITFLDRSCIYAKDWIQVLTPDGVRVLSEGDEVVLKDGEYYVKEVEDESTNVNKA